MAQNSKIEWTHHTANLWHKPRKEIKSVWNDLLKYQKLAKAAGEMHRVFVGSMMDIFEKPMPLIGAAIPEYTTGVLRERFFNQITEGWYPNLMFLLLTKRPSNINKYIPESWKTNPPANVMFGTSPVNQETADKLIPQLLKVNGKKFLSVEPQLGYIDLTGIRKHNADGIHIASYQVLTPIKNSGDSNRDAIDWVIQGGESGHHKRPFNLEWAYNMKQQCESANVPYFFKQIDKVQPIPTDLQVRQFPL